jgi:menin
MSELNKIKDLFPLNSFESVIKLFKHQVEVRDEPDLSVISICLGFLENSLCKENNSKVFPVLDFETLESLYKRFKSIVAIAETAFQTTPVSKSKRREENQEPKVATREKIKRINDVIWNSLLRSSYKDKAHLQSVYSYLHGNKLDSFGGALVTIAASQILKYNDVHLCISEDHAWLCFGKSSESSPKQLMKNFSNLMKSSLNHKIFYFF